MTTTVLVTGATDGIGRETAHELARRGYRVVVHGRKSEKLAAEVASLSKIGSIPALSVRADFARLDDVRSMVAELETEDARIDVLVNNAGIYAKRDERTPDGLESTMVVNHLAPFLLTHLLLASPVGAGIQRIVNVSSVAHARGRLDPEDPGGQRSTFDPYGSYAASKLANVLFTVELARRLGTKATVNALHPGVVSTKLLTKGFEMEGPDSLADGAATSVHLVVAPELEGVSGRYFSARREARPSTASQDPKAASRLYERSCELLAVAPL
jgi:NAD(P)-dependent dehydrogenase (short-subunit alcohol dehydrogenase family)